MKIVNVSQMQQAERDCAKYGISLDQLMQNAGKAFAEETRKILGDLQKQNILILVGPGNNGGDGLVAARHLYDWGTDRVRMYMFGKRPDNDPNLQEVKKRSVRICQADDDKDQSQFRRWLDEATTVIDAIFGTGSRGTLEGIIEQTLAQVGSEKVKRPELRIIALDLPSGLSANTGAIDPATPTADNTITLGFPKVGLFNLPGATRAGKISIVDIGIPEEPVKQINIELMTDRWAASVLPKRPQVSHKGSYGKVLAVVGSINYPGAAYLSCSGAMRAGAGLVNLAIARSLLPILASKLTEPIFLPLPEAGLGISVTESVEMLKEQMPQYNVLLMGCGLGQSQSMTDVVKTLLLDPQTKLPSVVLDADGLNALVGAPDWAQKFPQDAVFTPHAGEISRLLGKSISEIQQDRLTTAQQAAEAWHKTVVLKGAYTVIASPDGRIRVSPFANPGLSSAGTGDVLAGMIAGLAAQGLSLFDAASCGVYLHAKAGEAVRAELGEAGMLASDLLPALPKSIRQLKEV